MLTDAFADDFDSGYVFMIIESSSNTTLALPDDVLKLSGKFNAIHKWMPEMLPVDRLLSSISYTPTSLAWHGRCRSRPAKHNL